MKFVLAACVALAAAPAFAGGAPGVTKGAAKPCYPEDRLNLCPVPPVPVHRPGYIPPYIPSSTKVVTGSKGGFFVYVRPNAAPYEQALEQAGYAAAVHCGRQQGEQVVAHLSSTARYAESDIEAWEFAGACK
ncbi:hypothetical protein [Palleronia caenipelagi]|uniref:Secreted protein n=1 Tax=Palleronia caenipelagi TaxID=2489174 RepID=A0A547Q586_9RHOB|nr:hypothetical protein [Palleronia caenipelagi]TRD21507.1 hypothetical protein FEV53_08475 [Palleronia caenipelagi]